MTIMKMRFGLWLWSLGMWLTKKGIGMAGSLDHLSSQTATNDLIIHRVVDGPYVQADLGYEWDGPVDAEAYLVVLLEHNGETEEVEWYCATLDGAYDMVKHFKTSIEPIHVNVQGGT